MSRKSLMSKKKFKKIICHKCKTCEGNPNPTFCYKVLYKNNSGAFINELLPDILYDPSIRNFIKELEAQDFKDIFCEIMSCSGCYKDKKSVKSCMMKFINQVGNGRKYSKAGKGNIRVTYSNNKKKKEEKPAYASIIISDNDQFKERIRVILGNNNKQSNNNQLS